MFPTDWPRPRRGRASYHIGRVWHPRA